jgi:methylphosphotriester-DNA--protein-cysteine methyltransferase
MNTALKEIQNWEELALQAKWSATGLATQCHVPLRTLQRCFREIWGMSPKAWLAKNRQERAIEMLRNGAPVKVAALELAMIIPPTSRGNSNAIGDALQVNTTAFHCQEMPGPSGLHYDSCKKILLGAFWSLFPIYIMALTR